MYVILWEFVVDPARIPDFVSAYKADGDWAKLFSLEPGFQSTELLASTTHPGTFITIDRWNAIDDYESFQQHLGQQYKALDAQLAGLTLRETKLGTYLKD